jgi:cholesterol transport system auxiliary component
MMRDAVQPERTITVFVGRVLAVLLVSIPLSACTQPEIPQDRYYRIIVGKPEAPSTRPPLDGPLEVERPDADGLLGARPIVYAEAARPNELQEYSYDFWTEPPTLMLQSELVGYLRAARIADLVVTPGLRVNAAYRLSGRLRRLEQLVGDPSKVLVEIEFAVRDNQRGRITLLKTYRAEAIPADASLPAAVDAFGKAFTAIAARLAADLADG